MLHKINVSLLLLLFSLMVSSTPKETKVGSELYKLQPIGTADTRPVCEISYLKNDREDIMEEMRLGDMELVAQLVQAEAGTQDLTGKRYVVDVVLNRVDSEYYPNSVEEVIFQEYHFSVIKDGGFDKAGWIISEDSYEAVRLEYDNEQRLNSNILYFGTEIPKYADRDNCFKHQDHWFGY